MYTNQSKADKAHRRAMRRVIDKGQDYIAGMDGFRQFIENHYDGVPLTQEGREVMTEAISELDKAIRKVEKIEVSEGIVREPYFKHEPCRTS